MPSPSCDFPSSASLESCPGKVLSENQEYWVFNLMTC